MCRSNSLQYIYRSTFVFSAVGQNLKTMNTGENGLPAYTPDNKVVL